MKGSGSVRMWWLLRAYRGRNPLVRTSDRVELFVVTLGVLVALIATACAGALGTAVHDTRGRVYAAEAQTRHSVIGTAVEDSTSVLGIERNATTSVKARWRVEGREHTDRVPIHNQVKSGTPLTIWLNRDGKRVDAPTPTSQAGTDAVVAAVTFWLVMAFTVTGLMWLARSGLNRRRIRGWDRALRSLVHDGGSGNRKP
jgi:hypothetical protein